MKHWMLLVVVASLTFFTLVGLNKPQPLPRIPLELGKERVLETGSFIYIKQTPNPEAEEQLDSWYIVKQKQ